MLSPSLPPFARARARAAAAAFGWIALFASANVAHAQTPTAKPAAPAAPTLPTAAKPAAPRAAPAAAAKPPPTALPPGAPGAPSAAAPMPDLGDDAQRYFQIGQDALNRLAWNEAEPPLLKAWSLSKSFDVAAALGEAKLELGKFREAAEYLSFGLRSALPSTRARARVRLKDMLDKAKNKLATVKLSAGDPDAKLTIDGAAIDPIFFGPEVYVEPGKRTFEATREGFKPAASTVDVAAGQIYIVALKLEPTGGKKAATPPPPTPPAERWPAAVLGGAGGLAIVAGAVLVGLAEANKAEAYDVARNTLTAEGDPTCTAKGTGPTDACDKVRSAAANADLFGNVGIGSFIAGGVFVAGAALYVLWPRDEAPGTPGAPGQPAKTGRIIPVVGPNGGGLLWRGTF